ncbi:hypothetical protein HJC23_002740 [Cyclotella cryptica]|uniref:Methyltransferase domain-containing protein n=1 Tax=Cyclotella cryptica TaxID=29204 RepID=A0ABD3PRN1_9STRA|eukprot:CCRYP_012386-RA/>CCRYP_012386-RA protein AED:0.42 eAED:0.42 QI:0/-1/0/1/-1/1/1/0/407
MVATTTKTRIYPHNPAFTPFGLFMFLNMTVPLAAFSFSHRRCFFRSIPISSCGKNICSEAHTVTLHARGGAMARRKKQLLEKDGDESVNSVHSNADTIYSMPPLYDLAFGYRNYEEEVEFLLDSHRKYSKTSDGTTEPLRIIELAAGPARHSLAALSQHSQTKIRSVVALDRSKEMVDYGNENADVELGTGGGRRDDFSYVCGDMRNIQESINKDESKTLRFDTAWLLLGSMQHLLTNDDIIACFRSIHSVLNPGGTVVIELPHPRETFSMGECTRNGWTVPLVDEVDDDGEEKEYGELNIVWGDEEDEFDPVEQIRKFTVGMELVIKNPEDIPQDFDTSPLFQKMTRDGKTTLKEIVPMRLFTLQEVDALARCAGLELAAKYGALDSDVSIEDEEEAFRMVIILTN